MTTIDEPLAVSPARAAYQRMKLWALVFGGALLVVLGGAAALFFTASDATTRADAYGGVLNEQNGVIEAQCEAAGPSVAQADVKAQQACENVSRGLPPVPLPENVAPPADGADGIGISYTRQVDRCYVEVGLTDGSNSRFGPFCGAPGPTGPTGASGSTGPTGPTGPSGENGTDGTDGEDAPPAVGIRDIQTNGCMVDVVLTDDSVRTVGPFCGSPPGEYTEVRPDGSEKHCRRDGGADTSPRYVCTTTEPTATEPTVTTTDELLPLPTG